MPRVDVYLADPADLLEAAAFDAAATIDVYRSDDDGATFAFVDDIAITTTATQPFSLWDVAGDAASLYRWRISSADDTRHSEYSTPAPGILATATVPGLAYAQLADVMPLFKTPLLPARYARIASLIVTATQECIGAMAGRDFFRHPTTGTETWTTEGDGTDILHLHDGILSIDTLAVSVDGGASFTDILDAEWILEGRTPGVSEPGRDGEPSFHVRLVYPWSLVRSFPRSSGLVRITGGARGWPSVPAQLREATVERVRQLAAGDNTLSGALAGPPEYATGQPFEYWPQIAYRFLQDESDRFLGCYT